VVGLFYGTYDPDKIPACAGMTKKMNGHATAERRWADKLLTPLTTLHDSRISWVMVFPQLVPYQALMQGFGQPWCFGGGWAIDGLLGKVTREHADVDIVIWRSDQQAFRAQFADWEWQTFIDRQPRPWPAEEFLELPAHNAYGKKTGQELEILMLEREGDDWWFRRNPNIRMPADRVMMPAAAGFLVLNPAIALLFKSNRLDAKDQQDFNNVLPVLDAGDRAWLKQALGVMDAEHGWIERL
jgi:hypothetical protein